MFVEFDEGDLRAVRQMLMTVRESREFRVLPPHLERVSSLVGRMEAVRDQLVLNLSSVDAA